MLDPAEVRQPNLPLFAACEALLDFAKSHRPSAPADDDTARVLLHRTYIRASKGYQALFKLAYDGYGSQSFVIGRTVYEDMLVAHWIFLSPTHAPAKFRRYERLSRHRLRKAYLKVGLSFKEQTYPSVAPAELQRLEEEFKRNQHWTGKTMRQLHDAVKTEFSEPDSHRRLLQQVQEIIHALSNLAVHHSYLSLDAAAPVLPDGRRFADVGASPTLVTSRQVVYDAERVILA